MESIKLTSIGVVTGILNFFVYIKISKYHAINFPDYRHPDDGIWFFIFSLVVVIANCILLWKLKKSIKKFICISVTLPFIVLFLASAIGNLLMW